MFRTLKKRLIATLAKMDYEDWEHRLICTQPGYWREFRERIESQIRELKGRLEQYEVEPPKITDHILLSELRDVLKKACNEPTIYLSDMDYALIPKSEMLRFLKRDLTDLAKYTPEYYDCDDFSFRLHGALSIPAWGGIAFGIAWSTMHAYNIFVDDERKVWIIEPQTDRLMEPSNVSPYDTRLIIM